MTMAVIYERIDALADDQVLEAVNLLSGELLGPTPDRQVRSEVASLASVDEGVLDTALASAAPREIAELGRAVLVTAAVAGHERDVQDAIDAVGQKALLIELTIIGLLALGALHALRTGGKKKEVHEQQTTVTPDGQVTITTKDTVHYYSVGQALSPFAKELLKAILPG
jgi:hypothetical protein